MKRKKLLPLLVAALCTTPVLAEDPVEQAEEAAEEMSPIVVEGTKITDVSAKYVKSADLAEGLFKNVAEISLVRRSGIANDIILRGQKKDNINVLVDGAKIYGACPNRMDPPTSHILTNNVESVEINEGPYDVENFGTLSGSVNITTRAPEPGLHGDFSINVGSWNYWKAAATLTGGSDRVRALASISHEESDQYEDGDGNTFAEQIKKFYPDSTARYKPEYEDRKAYEKQTFMGKLYFDIAENQELKLGYTANRSDDVLYPSSKMDALYDNSDLFNVDYTATDLGRWSKLLEVKYYFSKVKHPMSTYYRISSGPGSANERISKLESEIQGLRVKNVTAIDAGSEIAYGIDTSKRNWDGTYRGYGMSSGITGIKSIDDVDTKNIGLFAEYERDFDRFNLRVGGRYDDTSIEPGSGTLPDNDYNSFSAFAFGTWAFDSGMKVFGGIGRSYRVPDARELYFRSAPMMGMPARLIGNPDLDQTSNTEIDLGLENDWENLYLKAKVFYSWLGDFIFYNDSRMTEKFENMDATLYGFSLNGTWSFTEEVYLDFGLAYQRGKKDDPLSGQSGTDMPEIPPLKGNLALNWEYMPNSLARAELIASDKWSDYDGENGEQELDSWAVLNLNVRHQLTDRIVLIGGIDNVFDETYAISNTYKDLTLLLDGTGEVMLMNEPGRYFYLNASYSF
ncbi:MAG: TonB-dependent receptor [Gammaproteobacteria bacterium]|nr:MAG: TonB-dependent receptor [Gammaproteobacteria bacterium]RTZ74859.1 MAG: TonB-dependent receptor [Gammaproteobacteria bacterium]RTZ77698.1 MAG: TonB-dependent receptor [Gammaproteobacteria bacterium]